MNVSNNDELRQQRDLAQRVVELHAAEGRTAREAYRQARQSLRSVRDINWQCLRLCERSGQVEFRDPDNTTVRIDASLHKLKRH